LPNFAFQFIYGPESFGQHHHDSKVRKGRTIVDEIFSRFSQWECENPQRLNEKYTVPQRVIRRWHDRWTSDGNCHPSSSEAISDSHRIFKTEDEAKIAERINAQILTPGQLFTDGDICSIAMNEFLLLHAHDEWKDIRDFHCNNGFIVALKK
jgi:hypothetical protein